MRAEPLDLATLESAALWYVDLHTDSADEAVQMVAVGVVQNWLCICSPATQVLATSRWPCGERLRIRPKRCYITLAAVTNNGPV